MASHHECIRIGDSEIVGEKGDVVQWKLDGTGFKEYKPVVSGDFNITDTSMTTTPVHIEIQAYGQIRVIHIFEVTVPISATPSTKCIINGALPGGHRPVSQTQFFGAYHTSTGVERPVIYIIKPGTGDIEVYTYEELTPNRINFPNVGTSLTLNTITDMYSVA